MCNVKVKFTGQLTRRSFSLLDALNGAKAVDQQGREVVKLTATRLGALSVLSAHFSDSPYVQDFHLNGSGKGNPSSLFLGEPTVTRWVNIRADSTGRLLIGSKLHVTEQSARSSASRGATKTLHTLSVQVPVTETSTSRLKLDL